MQHNQSRQPDRPAAGIPWPSDVQACGLSLRGRMQESIVGEEENEMGWNGLETNENICKADVDERRLSCV